MEFDIDEVKQNKASATKKLNNFFNELEKNNPSKLNKICYWINDYVNYLKREDNFHPETLIRYKRGDIIKVNFGFRVGAEFGGLHYCIVLDNDNSPKAQTITVLPLSSLKDGVDIHKLPRDRIYLGNELSDQIIDKADKLIDKWEENRQKANQAFNNKNISSEELNKISSEARQIQDTALKFHNEFKKIKHGSIGIVGQITTISKMRIYDPKHTRHVLSGVRLSSEKLDLVDNKIKELYMHKTTKK